MFNEDAGSIKGKFPDVIILTVEVKGSTEITETFSVEELAKLKISANWGGLTGTVATIISVFPFETPLTYSESITYFTQGIMSPIVMPLPSME